MGQTYYYARVSTMAQNLDRQLMAFKELGADERYIYTDKQSGKDFDRKSYNTLVGTADTAPVLRAGDTLVVYSIDRLGRNYSEIRRQWEYITHDLGAYIKVIDMPLLDTSRASGDLDSKFIADLVLQILSYVAEKERENIRIRQRQGLDAMDLSDDQMTLDGRKKRISKKTSRPVGRPQAEYPENWMAVYDSWRAGELTAVQAMEKTGLKKNSFYNLVKRYQRGK